MSGVGSLLACGVYWVATVWFAPEVTPGPVEFAGTATSPWSVGITQRRNVLALPVGIDYLPVQFWAWREWTRGGENHTGLLVTRLAAGMRVVVVAAMAPSEATRTGAKGSAGEGAGENRLRRFVAVTDLPFPFLATQAMTFVILHDGAVVSLTRR